MRLLDATNDLTPAEPLPIIAPRRIDHFYAVGPSVRRAQKVAGWQVRLRCTAPNSRLCMRPRAARRSSDGARFEN